MMFFLQEYKEIFRRIGKSIMTLFMILFYVLFCFMVLTGKTGLSNSDGIPLFFIQFLFVCGFLLTFHLSTIDLKKYPRAWIEIALLVSLLLQIAYIFFMPFGQEVYSSYSIFIFLTLVVFHLGIIILILDKRTFFRTRRILSSWDLVSSGIATFSLFVAMSFAFLAAGTWKSLPVSCTELYDTMGSFVQRLASPVLLGVEKASVLTETVQEVSQTTFGDIIGVDEENIPYLEHQLQSLEKNKNTEENGILSTLDERKVFLLEEAVDKSKINTGICEVIVNQINTKTQKPMFRYSVATLLFFLLYPLVRFFFFLVSIGSFIVFTILRWGGVYTWKKVRKEVEEIE